MITNETFKNETQERGRTAISWSAKVDSNTTHTVRAYEMRQGLVYVTWTVQHIGDRAEAGKFNFDNYNDARDKMNQIISAIVKIAGGREELADPDLPTPTQMQAMAEWSGADKPKLFECPHLGCDTYSTKHRQELVRHLTYWHRATEEEAKDIAYKQ